MSAAWDAWLAECLGALDIDADVFGPYVTGIMVRFMHGAAGVSAHVVPRARRWKRTWMRLWCQMLKPLAAPQEDETQQEAERASSVVRRCVDA